jgi:hypothetical protein
MRIDRDKLQKLLAMSDEELWRTVCAIGNDHGLDLPKAPPPKEDMARLRGAIDGNAGINVGEAIRVVKSYKRSEKNGRNP